MNKVHIVQSQYNPLKSLSYSQATICKSMAPPPKTARCQADFIYDFKWNSKIDDHFIDFLSFEARVSNFVWPHKVKGVLMHAIDSINYNHSQKFSYVYGLKKLDLLEQRYKTFSWMLSLDKVRFDSSTNMVMAPDSVWKFMFE